MAAIERASSDASGRALGGAVPGMCGGEPPLDDRLDAIAHWLASVERWNRKLDLTAARGLRELVDLMVADAALLARALPEGALVVDVGSGAGAPGLPLALLRPDLRVALVEPLQKRAAFLRSVLGELALASAKAGAGKGRGEGSPALRSLAAELVQIRGEELAASVELARPAGRTPFDVALSRATLEPAAWLALGARLAPGGSVWVLLAREAPPALEGWRVAHDVSYEWPLTGARRMVVGYERDR